MPDSPITLFFVVITSIVSIYAFSNNEVFNKLKLNPYMVLHRKEWGRVFGHAVLHSDWFHLIINMYVLYSFGGVVENAFGQFSVNGRTWYAFFYISAAVAATIPAFLRHRNSHAYNAVGASGAVSAIAFASILIYPTGRIAFVFIPGVQIPSYVFGIAYLIYSYFMSKRSSDNIAHDAHFAGAIYGLLFPLLIEPRLISSFFVQIFGGV